MRDQGNYEWYPDSDVPQVVVEKLQDLIDVPLELYKECINEGMSVTEAIEETRNRYFE
tara:strand:+ start:525 stop:698 length:174 start_codon:yes stop_codon:yes gene_type:complete